MEEKVQIKDSGQWKRKLFGLPLRGKMTDSQDCFLFYYRKINPRKVNFSLSATIEVSDASGVDFQTAYGIAAVDTVASAEHWARHRNLALVGRFRTCEGKNYGQGLRVVGGYTDPSAMPQAGHRRLDPSRLFQTQPVEDSINEGDRLRLKMVKTDEGLEASIETGSGIETVFFPGCDFLLKQDDRHIYVGFAIAGNIGLKIYDIVYEVVPGKLSYTPEGSVGHYVPDYPFDRRILEGSEASGTERVRDSELKVSPQGDPFDLESALRKAGPGCEIILSDGVYQDCPFYIPSSDSGEPGRPVTLKAEHPGGAILDGAGQKLRIPALTLQGNYWVLDGLVFRNSPSSGLFVCGSDNVVKNCEAYGNGDTGFLICSFPGAPRESWPSNNRIEYSLSHDNCDFVRRNADGFGGKLSIGEGNGFYSCRSFHNIDDGFDLYTKNTLGPIAPVVLDNCEAAYNGWLSSENKPGGEQKNGVGFKLGGEEQRVPHLLINCVAHDNAAEGFNPNSNPSPLLIGCEAWGNCPDYLNPINLHPDRASKDGLYLVIDKSNSGCGLTDRLKAAVGLYYIACLQGVPFKLIHSAGFDIRDYLVPNKVDWSAEPSDLSISPFKRRRFDYLPPYDQILSMRHGKQYICKRYIGKNIIEMKGVPEWRRVWRTLFFELFSPSEAVKKALEDCELPERYRVVNVRFVNSLGWNERSGYNSPLPPEERNRLIEAVLSKVEACEAESGIPIIVYSDRKEFLEAASNRGFRICEPAGVGHIMNEDAGEYVILMTFVYFFQMARAEKIYSILDIEGFPSDCLYKSQYPRYAAIVGDKPFVRL